jgi:N-acetylmuramoyl-L-alanine amidase
MPCRKAGLGGEKVRIYPADITEKFIRKVNSWLYLFEKAGTGNFMVNVNEEPFRAEWVRQAFDEIEFPLGWMQGFEIFIMPYKLTTVDSKMSPAGYYEGQAFANHFVIGTTFKGENTYKKAAVIATHETGHILTYRFIDPVYEDKKNTDKMKEYMQIRGLDPRRFGYGFDWNLRVWEVLAEDFRYLFGGVAAHSEKFIHDTPYVGLEPPDENVRRWFLGLVPEGEIEIEIVGMEAEKVAGLNYPEYIIVHHSASEKDNAETIDRNHRAIGYDGNGYNHIIGNGTLSGDGEIELGRAEHDIGAHCRGYNDKSIGICLVGNFEEQYPSTAQMDSLDELCRNVMARYSIPIENVLGHGEVCTTACPGKNFNMNDLRGRLKMAKTDYDGHWAKASIEKAVQSGVMVGYGGDVWEPDKPLTRAEFVVVLDRLGLLERR